jgi:predicted phage terminase large subunit-like protein
MMSTAVLDALPLAAARLILERERQSRPVPWKADPASFAVELSAGDWWRAPHLDLLSSALLDLAEGRSHRLIVQMPPRHGKSEMVSHWFPAWYLDRHPGRRVILSSYGDDFAAEWGRKVRNTLQEHRDRLRVRVSDDSHAANRWHTSDGGGMITAGAGGPITGRGANLLVIDDPIKNPSDAQSQIMRDHLWDWWHSTARTRLEPHGAAVVLMTRWHEDDLVGRLLEQMSRGGEAWRVIRLPAAAEGTDELGRPEGAALWPARYDEQALAAIRGTDSTWVWDALYQQRPSAPGGSIFRRDWWAEGQNRFDNADPTLARRAERRYISLDTAFKESDSSAYTACIVGELSQDYQLFIREVWREKLSFPDLIPAIVATARRHNVDGKLDAVIIEDRASGISATQTLRASSPADLRGLIVPWPPSGSKADRAKQVSLWCRNRCIHLPHPSQAAPWLYDFEQELYAAPFGTYMDQVDAFSQLLLYLEPTIESGWHARGMAA